LIVLTVAVNEKFIQIKHEVERILTIENMLKCLKNKSTFLIIIIRLLLKVLKMYNFLVVPSH